MEIKLAVRHGAVEAKIRNTVETLLQRIARIVGDDSSANVVLNEENARQLAEVTIACRHHTIVAKAEGFDREQVVQAVMEKAEKQAHRYHERQRTQKRKPLPV